MADETPIPSITPSLVWTRRVYPSGWAHHEAHDGRGALRAIAWWVGRRCWVNCFDGRGGVRVASLAAAKAG